MKLGLISLISPFIAIPMAYLPFRARNIDSNKTLSKHHEWNGNGVDESNSIRYKTMDLNLITDDYSNESPNKQVYDGLNLKQVVLGYFGSYMVYKLFTKLFRSLAILSLISILLLKIVMTTDVLDKWHLFGSLDRYIGIRSGINMFQSLWEYHKPHIGEYIEHFVCRIVHVPIPELFISGVVGIVAFAIVG